MKSQIIIKNKHISELSITYRFMKPGNFFSFILCFIVFSFSNDFAQRFSIEQTEEFLNEYWVATSFENVSYLNFTDSLNGHIAEYSDRFATTTDGGANWKNRTTLQGQLRDADIIMLSRDTLFYISVNKKLVTSYDGGGTWTISGNVTGIPVDISSMVFYTILTGICVTVDGMIYTTSNGGFDWLPYPDLTHNDNTILKIYGDLTICYGSNHNFLLSSDKGNTWQKFGYTDSINTPNFIKIMNEKLYISAAGNTWYKCNLTGQILFQETLLPLTKTVKNFAFPNENEVWASQWDATSKVSVPGSRVWTNSSYPSVRNIGGVFESFNGSLLVAASGVDDAHAMIRLKNPGKKFSVKKGRLPGNCRLSTVKILSEDATYVGSFEGVIFRSTDRGLSWEVISGNNQFPAILCISAKNNMNIFTGCMGGIILKTTDGGTNWTQIATTIKENITSIEYKDADTLFLTTETAAYVVPLSNLQYPLKIALPGNPGKVIKVKFWDRYSGFIGGNYISHKTSNGGKSWVEESNGYLWPTALSIMPGLAKFYLTDRDFIEIRLPLVNYFLYSGFKGSFDLVDNDSTAGFILDTYYGAVVPIYTREPKYEYFLAGGQVPLNDFDYFNSGYSLAVGDGGVLLFPAFKNSNEAPPACTGLLPAQSSKVSGKSINFSWKEPYLLVPNDEFQIEIARDDTANIVFSQSGITTTTFTATGLTEEKRHFWRVRAKNSFGWGDYTPWTTFFLMREVYSFREVTLPRWATVNAVTQTTDSTLWAVGDSGFVARSTTQGDLWELVSFPFVDDLKYCSINPFNNTLFFSSTSGDLIYTTDNGSNWQRTPSGVTGAIVRSIIFSNETYGYLSGTNRLASRTMDGGLTWFLSSVPTSVTDLGTIFETNEGHLLIAGDGGKLLRSTDFGRHYYPEQIFSSDNYRALFMFNSRLHILNEYGNALTSTDNGTNWQELHLNFDGTLRQVDFSGNRFRILSNSGGLFTSTLQGDMLNFQQLPGGSGMKSIFSTSSGNLIVVGSGNHLLVGRDTAVVSSVFADGESHTYPAEYILYQNYPNPFNGTTVIPVRMARSGFATIEIFNSSGEKVTTLLNREIESGDHSFIFDSGGLPSGIYFYRFITGNTRLTGKMILLK